MTLELLADGKLMGIILAFLKDTEQEVAEIDIRRARRFPVERGP
jgi:hypothetical protein